MSNPFPGVYDHLEFSEVDPHLRNDQLDSIHCLEKSITQISDLRLELTATGLDQKRHQATPLQNQLLTSACTSLEAWLEIQNDKLRKARKEVEDQVTHKASLLGRDLALAALQGKRQPTRDQLGGFSP